MGKKLKKRLVSLALLTTLLIGSAMSVQADTPVCGGNHSYSTVRVLDSSQSESYSHQHDGQLCFYYYVHKRVLERCACGAERVNTIDYTVHTKTGV